MPQGNTQDLYSKYLDASVSVTTYATARMGLVTGQTVLHIDTYNIICIPYKISMKSATMIASFSREEFMFFQRYLNAMSGLTLLIQSASSPQQIKIFARSVIKSITPMKGRENLGFIALDWKPCPPDLITMVGDFLMLQDRLKQEYEDFKPQKIVINPESAKLMGYNNFAEISYEGASARAAVFLLSTGRVDFLVPTTGPTLESGKEASIKLFFQSFQFSVTGQIAEIEKLPNGAQKIGMTLAFSPELTDIIEKYRFSERLNVKTSQSPEPNSA